MKVLKVILLILLVLFSTITFGCDREYGLDEIMHLYAAIGKSDYGKVKRLVSRYPKIVNALFRAGNDEASPLMSALAIGDIGIVNLLLEKGADVNYQDLRGVSVLNATIQGGNVEQVKLILEAGADVGLEDNMELGVYHYALYKPSLEMLDLLYEYSKLIDEPDANGTTPLLANMSSRHEGRDPITLWFLKKGASFDIVIELVPEMIPAFLYKKRNEVNKYLLENTPSYRNYIDPAGQTVSHFSVEFGNDEVLDCLLENKYYSNAENDKGETPLEMAVRMGRKDMVKEIEAYLKVTP